MVAYPPLTASTVTPVTVANSVTETVVSKLTIPAGMAKVGSSFQGIANVVVSTPATGTPQITATVRIGGVAGVLLASIVIPATVAQTNVSILVFFSAACTAIGASGTWTGAVADIDVLTGPAANVIAAPTPVTKDTTVANDLVLTLTWGAAVAGNTYTATYSTLSQTA
jgi:hypothetical protein